MVRFSNPARPASGVIRIWCTPDEGGFRLVHRDPNGGLAVERCPDRAALFDAAVRLQTALTRAGWRPCAHGGSRHHAARARHFHPSR